MWYPPTDEVFFVQNAGAKAAGTGLNKSAIIEKISLADAAAVSGMRNASGQVNVTTVPSNPMVVNPNGMLSILRSQKTPADLSLRRNQLPRPDPIHG